MDDFKLKDALKGKRAELLGLGIPEATVGRLIYKDGWRPKSGVIIKLRDIIDIPFALTGAELAARMKRLNVSIAHLHRQSGVARGIIGRYLHGQRQLRMDTLQKLVAALPDDAMPDARKLSDGDIQDILASTEKINVLARRYDIDPSYVSHLRRRHRLAT